MAHFVDQYEQVYDLAFNYDEERVQARDADSGEEVLLETPLPQAQSAQGWAAQRVPWTYGQEQHRYGVDAALRH